MSFAIIETGGKQYKVTASKILEIEKLNAKVGETIKFDNVLLLNDDKNTEVGSPKVDGATVEAKLLDNVKDRTVLIFHKRRRKHSRKKNGHRQRHSKIQITKILAKGGKVIDESKIVEKKKAVKEIKKEIKKTKKKSIEINSNLKRNLPTIPTTIGDELKSNIFLRCNVNVIKQALNLKDAPDQEIFTKLRDLKDAF